MNVDQLSKDLVTAGFSTDWVADMLAKHGPQFLALVQKALVLGLTAEVIVDLVKLAGAVALEIIQALLDPKPVLFSDMSANEKVKMVLAKYKD